MNFNLIISSNLVHCILIFWKMGDVTDFVQMGHIYIL